MKTQFKQIKLLENGTLKLNNGRIVTPKNKVISLTDKEVTFAMNNERYIGRVDTDDYFRLSLWAHTLTYDHADLNKGVIAFNNGYEHKSLPAAIMHTTKDKKVYYNNYNRFDCRKQNLTVTKNDHLNKKKTNNDIEQISLWDI